MPAMQAYNFVGTITIDGTAKQGVNVMLWDKTQIDNLTSYTNNINIVRTNSSGVYNIDLANVATEAGFTYADGDTIILYVWYEDWYEIYETTVNITNTGETKDFTWTIVGVANNGVLNCPDSSSPTSGLRHGLKFGLVDGLK